MRHVIYALIAIVIGYGITLLFYMVGEPLVSPSLFLARQLSSDNGGDSLLPAFTFINTLICAVVTYLVLWCITWRRR